MNDDVNDDETEAEYEAEQDLDAEPDTEFEVEEDVTTPASTKFGRKFVLGGFAVSILLGGALGVIGSKVFAGPDKTIPLRAEFQQSLDELRQSTQSQTKRLGSTADSVQKKSQSRLDTLQAENISLASQVGTLEQTIARLQNNTAAEVKAFTDRIAVLEALSGEDTDVFTGANSITARLDALEESALASASVAAVADGASTNLLEETIATDISDIKRISVQPQVNPTRQSSLDHLIDTFPRTKLIAAVKAQEKTAGKKAGWLKRALSKHIRVGNDNAPDPYVIIDTAEAALKNGQVSVALEQLAQLNPPVRTSAADWVEAAKKAAPNIE